MAAEVKKIQKRLKEIDKKAKQFNQREALFNRACTDYSDVQRVIKNFEPYGNLWSTAFDWVRSQKVWFDDPFNDLDGDTVAKQLETGWRTMHKVCKFFESKYPEVYKVASDVRDQMDQFKTYGLPHEVPVIGLSTEYRRAHRQLARPPTHNIPYKHTQNTDNRYVPLIQALRNPGMKDRHWDTLSNELGFNCKPDEHFTLRKAIEELHLQDHTAVITKVCDLAAKEYSIEQALDKMEFEWYFPLARTHARTHAHTLARTHTRSHART